MALSRSKVFYYGLTDLPVQMSLFPVLVFIPKYYSSDLGVSLARGQHHRAGGACV